MNAEVEKKSRVGNVSAGQKEAIIEFMQVNPQLLSGKFTSEFTFKTAQKLWTELGEQLNSFPGAKKDWKQWRKTWQDIRTKTKNKNNNIKKYTGGTGGGKPTTESWTKIDENVLNLLNPTALDGHINIPESTVDFNLSGLEGSSNQFIYSQDNEMSANVIINTPLLTEIEEVDEDVEVISAPKSNSIAKPKRRVALRRLEHTVAASEKLAQQCEEKIKRKDLYYKKKLELLERDVVAKERIANALVELINKLPK